MNSVQFSNFKSHSSRNIDLLTVKPSGVTTAMTEFKSSPVHVHPALVARGVFRELGFRNETYGAFNHCL